MQDSTPAVRHMPAKRGTRCRQAGNEGAGRARVCCPVPADPWLPTHSTASAPTPAAACMAHLRAVGVSPWTACCIRSQSGSLAKRNGTGEPSCHPTSMAWMLGDPGWSHACVSESLREVAGSAWHARCVRSNAGSADARLDTRTRALTFARTHAHARTHTNTHTHTCTHTHAHTHTHAPALALAAGARHGRIAQRTHSVSHMPQRQLTVLVHGCAHEGVACEQQLQPISCSRQAGRQAQQPSTRPATRLRVTWLCAAPALRALHVG
jgi:hypothetical protein